MINDYGWSDALARLFEPHADRGLLPARVVLQQRGRLGLMTDLGEIPGELSGRFLHEAARGEVPVAGDWVAIAHAPGDDRAIIHALLPRTGAFSRKGPHGAVQVAAANVDVAFLAASLNADLSLRRIERYLANAYEGGADPVVVLTKLDLCDDPASAIAEVEEIAYGVPVIACSAVTGEGLDVLSAHLAPGRTGVLLGSSGVGKSTLVNALAGAEIMATREIIEEGARGKHTTTHRELIRLPTGALLLDTPGMREIGVFGADSGVSNLFNDIESLAEECRFNDCKHSNEPGCAVRAARESGDLDEARWQSFVKLQKELAFEARKEDPALRAQERAKWIAITKSHRRNKNRW